MAVPLWPCCGSTGKASKEREPKQKRDTATRATLGSGGGGGTVRHLGEVCLDGPGGKVRVGHELAVAAREPARASARPDECGAREANLGGDVGEVVELCTVHGRDKVPVGAARQCTSAAAAGGRVGGDWVGPAIVFHSKRKRNAADNSIGHHHRGTGAPGVPWQPYVRGAADIGEPAAAADACARARGVGGWRAQVSAQKGVAMQQRGWRQQRQPRWCRDTTAITTLVYHNPESWPGGSESQKKPSTLEPPCPPSPIICGTMYNRIGNPTALHATPPT